MNNNSDFNLFSLAIICSLVLAVVKLCGLASISWLIVFMPMIVLLVIDLVIYLVHRN